MNRMMLMGSLGILVWTLTVDSLAIAEPRVTKRDLGDVAGTVVKSETESITLKIPTMVQSGTTNRRSGGRNIRVPKYTVKQIEKDFPVAKDVIVRTLKGKSASRTDVHVGDTVRLHVFQITEKEPGHSAEQHLEVRRIDIPTPPKP
ncbi:hypothetical protein [Tuwongella immobilis]|uniref:Uncharacterized protein n=1 Tax=Tuwongella immobilis TaxID=692036 RepID=A0A6C2YSY8_9BACT|nr:hypothetical protein [Tuwongella immobilis]VIP04848.1 unnamed protein product [Tuwongella immobilis]VTS07056.1 unnamed protein product [Tuwongella immobilis]